MYINVIDRIFSILVSSCGTTMADFIGRYGEYVLKSELNQNLKIYCEIGFQRVKMGSKNLRSDWSPLYNMFYRTYSHRESN